MVPAVVDKRCTAIPQTILETRQGLLRFHSKRLPLAHWLVEVVCFSDHTSVITQLLKPPTKIDMEFQILNLLFEFKQILLITCLITVAFPVKGPNLISPKGGLNPSRVRASSCVIGGRLRREKLKVRGTISYEKRKQLTLHFQLWRRCNSSRRLLTIYHTIDYTVVWTCSTCHICMCVVQD